MTEPTGRARWLALVLLTACSSTVESQGRSIDVESSTGAREGDGAASKSSTGAREGDGAASKSSTDARSGDGAPPGSSITLVNVSVVGLYKTEVPACPTGYAHPNICCRGAPYTATTCTESPARPFGACDENQFAYPDPKKCCSLDDETACTPPPGGVSNADAGQPEQCLNPCSPGAFPPSLSDYAVSRNSASACCFGSGLSCAFKEPPCLGLCKQPAHYCDAPCPGGWSSPSGGQIDLCCRRDSDGQTSCFSKSTYIGGVEGGGGYADASGCRTDYSIDDGNSYVMKCTFSGSTTCTCLLNGTVSRTLTDPGVPDAGLHWLQPCDISRCGFPSAPQ